MTSRILIFFLLLLSHNVAAFQGDTILLDKVHGGDGSAWGQRKCSACHLVNFIHEGLSIREIVRDKGYESCTGCHGSNGTDLQRPCQICHNSTDLPHSPQLSGQENHNFVVGQTSFLSDDDCLSCHLASDMDSQFIPDVDLTRYPDAFSESKPYKKIYPFCLRCHNLDHQQPGFEIPDKDYRDPLVAMQNNYRYIDMHGQQKGSGERLYAGLVAEYRYATVVECTDCHSMHGTHNQKLIIDRAAKGATKLQDGENYHVDVVNGDYSQLCVLCHRMQNIVEEGDVDTGNGLSGVHMTGPDNDCRTCHTHGQAAQTGL